MRIARLTATAVRNLGPVRLEPSERFNVFVGDNGQGKTNLLEAIYVVATLRSFRTARLADLVAFGRDEAALGAPRGNSRSSGVNTTTLKPPK